MSHNIYSQSGQITYGIKYYTVDTENDKTNLPTKDKMGSKCYVIESKKWYILNGSGEWVPFVPEDGTPEAVLGAFSNMTAEQKAAVLEILGIEEGGSGLERFIVAFTPTLNGYTADKTFAEVAEAVDAGKYVEGQIQTPDDQIQYAPLVTMNDGNAAEFRLATYDDIDVYLSVIFLGDNDAVTVDELRLVKENIVQVGGDTPVIAAEANHMYKCGTVTSLSFSAYPSIGSWSVRFTSGSTATTLTMPVNVIMPDGFEVEANMTYEINVLDNYALVASWPVASS